MKCNRTHPESASWGSWVSTAHLKWRTLIYLEQVKKLWRKCEALGCKTTKTSNFDTVSPGIKPKQGNNHEI